ncbi:MAG: hypothetical protein GKR91_00855 [Pseudomonadales bacterium]|nr:hypothetical protein [Pseudomonadales bacterium]
MIKCESQHDFHCIGANVFERDSLQFTVKLLRNHNPSLALRVQNIIAPNPFIQRGANNSPQSSDLFPLNLDSFTLKRIIETLAIAGQELAEKVLETQQGDEAFLIQTKEVIGQWLLYAKEQKAIENFATG